MPKFLVDTCIWSEVLRRRQPNPVIRAHLTKMLRNLQAILIGPVRQELLSGISDDVKFRKLKDMLAYLPDIPIVTADYELAAYDSNLCRRKGIQGSAVDFLICAVAVRNACIIYTVDKDFERYQTVLPIRLWMGHDDF